jgi:hypothetical protein
MDVLEATADFERWLAQRLTPDRSALALKHKHMAEGAFPFFRATFYRWAQLWPRVCPELARAPRVLAVGDLHVENFGLWRDTEGRLIWGVNDLDEAWPGPYTLDLVRLTASAYLALREEHLAVGRRAASEAIEEGYRDAMAAGGGPFVLAEHHRWLRLLALNKLRDPVGFWEKISALPAYPNPVPAEAKELLKTALPSCAAPYQLKKRIAGLGSLGHPRILALGSYHGSYVAREAKAMRPSAWLWAANSPRSEQGECGPPELYSDALNQRALRVQDPFLQFHGAWLVRRLAPDCSRIELSSLPKERDESKLLYSMGWEAANLHLGTPSVIARLRRDLAARRGPWLHKAAKAMSSATVEDWEGWRKTGKRRAAH